MHRKGTVLALLWTDQTDQIMTRGGGGIDWTGWSKYDITMSETKYRPTPQS